MDHPIKLGITVKKRVGLRPNLSADQPAIPPPNSAPNGAIAYK